tara:strand:+ start:248 stop:451 length:204 start_codon:yes stop_codon:yes gene_type:complete
MGRKRKPTNKELTEGIMYLHQKLDNYFITQQTLFKDYVEFEGKVDKFQKFLEDKYENKKEQDSKESK